MTVPAHIAQTLVELRAKRDFLNTAITVLAQIYEDSDQDAAPGAAPALTVEAAPRPPAARTSKAAFNDSAIVKAIRNAGGAISPGDLAAALGVGKYGLKLQTAPLLERGEIVVTGVTTGRRFSLPGKQPAKEAP